MRNLRQMGLMDSLNRKVMKERTPILGICLGMQLFTDYGEEGGVKGLGWIKGRTICLKPVGLPVPHVGWNTIRLKKDSKLFDGMPQDYRYYFIHSYYVQCEDEDDILATTEYGTEFTSAVEKDNIIGTQFHPEKSHQDGLRIIKNFITQI